MGFFSFLPPLTYRVSQYMLTAANSQKNPLFNLELHSLFRTQLMHLHKCHLTILNIPLNMRSLLKKVSQNGLKLNVPKKSPKMVTHQSSLHHVDIPVPNGNHCVEQIRHSNFNVTGCHRRMMTHIGCQLSHRDAFWDNKVFCSCSGH